MSVELQSLFGVVVIYFLTIGIQGALTAITQGVPWGVGARDDAPDLSRLQKRAARTVANNSEALLMFTPLILIAHISQISTDLTVMGALLFLAARALYVPIYLLGVPVVRTLVWTVGLFGLVLIGYAIFSQGF